VSYVKFNMDGFDRAIQEMKRRVQAVTGNIPLDQLLSDDFMSRRTPFASFNDMLQQSGFQVETPEDFQRILGDKWDHFIAQHTSFTSWEEMLRVAWEERAVKRL
jgi:hypothetical protein